MSDFVIDSVGPDRGPEIRRLMDLAFNDPRPFDPDEPRFDEGRVVGAFDGDRLLGTVMTYEFSQVFGGREVPCGGVAGVTVAPDARGRDLARRMLAESFVRMRDRGEVVSSLYPTTSLLYGGLGYGVAGEFAHRRVPLGAIGPAQPLAWSECDFGCHEMREIQRSEAARRDGWVLPSSSWWDHQTWRRSGPPSDRVFSWLGRRDDEPVAVVVYTYGEHERTLYDLRVQLLAGVDAPAVRSALSFLASNGSTAESLDTTVPGPILDITLARPELAKVESDWPWMLRIIDLEGAIAARGYPSGAVTIDLDVTDHVIDHNLGAWTLRVDEGVGSVVRGGDATVSVDIADLARIYAGADPRLLHSDGRLEGITSPQLDQLAGAFATRATLPIFF